MRKRTCVRAALLCALAASAAVPASAAAAPRHDDGLTIAATPNTIVAGTGVLIYGQLKGSDVAGQPIDLYHRVNPAAHFSLISKTTTDQYGFYEFTRAEGVVVSNRNWYVEGPATTHSKTIHERVASTLTLSESSTATTTSQKVLFTGTVYPAHEGQRVLIQEQNSVSGNGWHTVASGRTDAASAFSIAHAFRGAGDYTLRAFLPTDARNIAGSSDATTLTVQQTENPSFTISSSADPITVGQSATLTGTLYEAGSTTNVAPGVSVALYAKSVGGSFAEVSSTVTGADGTYSFSGAPEHNMVYKVVRTASPRDHTADLYEAVADTVSLTSNTTSTSVGSPVSFSGSVSPDHTGHAIYLQIETAKGGYQDVVGSVVQTGSTYTISYGFGQPGTYTVRARIFGGPENVGAGSPTVTVTVAGYAAASGLPPAS
jgi:hypothetical protein